MALAFTNRKTYKSDPKMKLCGGWKEECITPVGRYSIDFIDYMNKPAIFHVAFGSKTLGVFPEEHEAVSAAQDHFNALIKQCQKLVTE
ncbi:MAG: hypothetical protein AAFR27_12365 [Pseudomonadota bacterium]